MEVLVILAAVAVVALGFALYVKATGEKPVELVLKVEEEVKEEAIAVEAVVEKEVAKAEAIAAEAAAVVVEEVKTVTKKAKKLPAPKKAVEEVASEAEVVVKKPRAPRKPKLNVAK